MMSDGRILSSWQPEAVINRQIQKNENIKTNWDYRQFMQTNGLKIMKYNSFSVCAESGLDPIVGQPAMSASNAPFMFNSTFDSTTPKFGYCASDLKSPYLSREQLNARMVAPTVNHANIIS